MNEEERKNYMYIGDGVYAFFDGYGIWLRAGNHDELLCSDRIYLEPKALERLKNFNTQVRQKNE